MVDYFLQGGSFMWPILVSLIFGLGFVFERAYSLMLSGIDSAKFFVMVGLVSRLFFLQVKENKKYLTLSDKNRIREWKLAPVRGEFHDYFGNVIAGNFET